jgi:uncharacterized membrane protein
MADGVAFCPKCGAPAGPVVVGSPAPVSGPVVTPAASGLAENVAGLLCYLGWWVTGLIFLLTDKRPFVRFHAAQSIAIFGAWTILWFVLHFTFGVIGLGWILSMILGLLDLLVFVAWIVLMVMAYQGKTFEVPVAAGIAKSIMASVKA